MAVDFLPRTLLFYLLSHAYLFQSFHRLLGMRRIFFAALPLFVLMGLYPYVYHQLPAGMAQDLFGEAGVIWLPAAFFCLIVFALADILSLASLAFRRLFPAGALLFFSRRRYFALLVAIAFCLYGYGLYEAHDLRVTHVTLATHKLPEETKRLRIVFASDLHIGPQTGTVMLAKTVDAMLAQDPDLVLLGGDILDDAFQGTPGDVRELRRLRAPFGVYAVLGNHDSFGGYRHAVDTLSLTGITLLSDEAVTTGPVRIVGLDDPDVSAQKYGQADGQDSRQGDAQEYGKSPAEVLGAVPLDRLTILLSHRPRLRQETAGLFDIQLSGHTHGGQIILLKRLVESVHGVATGFSSPNANTGESALFVTTGTGFSKLPIRLFVPPEIVVLDIERVPESLAAPLVLIP